MHIFYLHGFASSPASSKALFFARHLAEHGVHLECPDLNQPDFASLTVSRMIEQLDVLIEAREPGPVALIGSSLGGFTALHAADRRNRIPGQERPVTRLVLLAPALDFGCDPRMDAVADDWRRTGSREVFHYAEGRTRRIGYALYQDAHRYDTSAIRLDIPILIFQGRQDDVVLPSAAIEFARQRRNVTLRLLDDDHRLQEQLPHMWGEAEAFLGLGRSQQAG